jgi:hypothetical protein
VRADLGHSCPVRGLGTGRKLRIFEEAVEVDASSKIQNA